MKNLIVIMILSVGFILGTQNGYSGNPVKKEKTKVVEMKVGFHCPGGKASIEKMLSEKEGVVSYDVNLQSKMVKITYNPAKIDEAKLQESILNLGYSVNDKSPEKKHSCGG